MSMMEAVGSVFKNYANFKGRARRSEYWKFMLFSVLIYAIGLVLIAATIDTGRNVQGGFAGFVAILLALFMIACIIPSFSVTCRRLHDVGKSGAYFFVVLVPVIGEILVWIWSIQDGEPWTNRYGPDPKGREMSYRPDSVPSPAPAPEPKREKHIPTPEPYTSKDSDSAAASKRCRYCNSTMPASANFCPKCGMDTSSDSFITPKPVPPATPEPPKPSDKNDKGFYIPTDLD